MAHEHVESAFENNEIERQSTYESLTSNAHSTPREVDPNPSSSKRPRTSDIWQHYTRFKKTVAKGEEVEIVEYARCNLCAKEYKAPGKAGTSTCRTHINKCLKDHGLNQGVDSKFDQKIYLHMFAKAIICHAYPLRIVEHKYLRELHTYMVPTVKHVCRNTILKYCIREYEKYRTLLLESLANVTGRVSFTSDLWTACNNRGYLTLTAHYVDDSWSLRSKILNFRYCGPPHTGVEVGKFVFKLITEWKLEGKAFSMTVDNARSMDVMVDYLKKELMQKSPLPCNGKFFHIRCSAHVLNIIVQRGLKQVDESVVKLREVIKYIDGSDSRLTQFEFILIELQCIFNGKLCLDVVTRWNSTYTMLRKALEAKEALIVYTDRYMGVNYRLNAAEWDTIKNICAFLQPFYEITALFSGVEYPTANLYFVSVLRIEHGINQAHKNPNLAPMAASMLEKFEGYWEDYSLILSVAIALDPRYKLHRVKKLLSLLYVGEACEEKVNVIKDALCELYKFYSTFTSNSGSSCRITTPPSVTTQSENDTCFMDSGDVLKLCVSDDEDADPTGSYLPELESYLNGPLQKLDEQNFDVLKYWESQVSMLPVLANMAKDILAIPITSVASESSFSMGGRILNKYRGSLLPKNVEALVTTQNWCLGYEGDVEEDILLIGKEMEAESTSST